MTQQVHAQFILNDLKLGLTLLDIARSTHNPETAQRNIANAHRVYDMVMHQLLGLHAGRHERAEIKAHFNRLRDELRSFAQPPEHCEMQANYEAADAR